MSRQQKRAIERKKSKTAFQKICLAAGEGVGKAVAFTFALAGHAVAAEPQQDAPITLPPVVVQEQPNPLVPQQSSLTRMPVPLRDLPQSITIVPQQIIQQQAGSSLRDALRNVSGIGIAAGEGGGAQGDAFTLRGFNARNDMFLDGVRDQGSYNRDLFNLESVEVLKGPSSFYFGRGSTGGIINQVGKMPSLDPSYSGTFGIGSGIYLRGTADINHPISDSVAFRINAIAQHADIVDRDHVDVNRLGLAPSITFGLGTPTQFTFSYLIQHDDNTPDYGVPFIFGKPPRINRDTFFGFPDHDYERTWVNVGTFKMDHRFSEQLNLRSLLRYGHVSREAAVTPPRINGNPPPGTPLSAVTVNRNRPTRDTDESILTNQTDLIAKFDTWGFQHTLNTGLEISYETFDSKRWNQNAAGPTPILNPNSHAPLSAPTALNFNSDTDSIGFGIFAADQIRLNDYFQLVGGVRWDYFKTDVDDKLPANQDRRQTDKDFSYRGGLIFQPVQWQSYYFSYGSSFNPSAESLSLAAATDGVPPEENEMFEIGAKLEFFNGALNAQAALFRINKDHARVPNPIDPTGPNIPDGRQRVQGVELGLAGRVLPGWNVFAGYTYLDSETRSSTVAENVGKELQNVPKHSANLWTTYDFLEKWQIGGGPTYVGRRFANANNTNTIPSYVRWDATVAYSLTPKIQFRLNGLNLTDKRYYENTHPAHVVPAAGLTVIFGTSVKF